MHQKWVIIIWVYNVYISVNMTGEEMIEFGKLKLDKCLTLWNFELLIMVCNVDAEESIVGNKQFIFERKSE